VENAAGTMEFSLGDKPVPKYEDDDDDDRMTYPLAPEPRVNVSGAGACTTQLSAQKRAAVKGYVNRLGPKLREQYGKRDHYTPEQVQHTVVVTGLNVDYMCWAYLIYCTAPDFARIHEAAGEVCDYSAMREVVGGAFFGGNADFVASDVVEALVSGAAEAAVSGGGSLFGWLAEVDWSCLLDWS
jgi:hypothetical protein